MQPRFIEQLKHWLRPVLYRQFHRSSPAFECPICGYHGPFKRKRERRDPRIVRHHSKCVQCGASERHRMQHLLFAEVLSQWNVENKSVLHVAPESCLQPALQSRFGVYHTADLFRSDVNFKEDIQRMSFPDASYDCVVVSRVLAMPENLEACIREVRRILKPGGIAVLCEAYTRDKTTRIQLRTTEAFRELGVDVFHLYEANFDAVERWASDRYDAKHQLLNRIRRDGQVVDSYPDAVRVPGEGYQELVAICRVKAA